MEIILLWTIWFTAFTAVPEAAVMKQACLDTHPEAYITFSPSVENIKWNGRNYPAKMLICARKEKKAVKTEI